MKIVKSTFDPLHCVLYLTAVRSASPLKNSVYTTRSWNVQMSNELNTIFMHVNVSKASTDFWNLEYCILLHLFRRFVHVYMQRDVK